ncbi:hypothetical protein [Nocardia sp. alder85J]|uniref:hypothetical protein n=1 Tax=Nocardia sp. alder85J TaxID=2862949 RepID=UPI001CD330FB|nr:hypothetical protein [Nocardia sp. alder85J]MCX4097709.1 hypothetical protein [Nocardia sp. alder85J]
MFEEWPDSFDPPLRRVIDPPLPVAVHLPTALPTPAPKGFGQNKIAMRIKAGGIDLMGTTPGLLRAWVRASEGTWFGLVEVVLRTGNGRGRLRVTQLCPAAAIRPRDG